MEGFTGIPEAIEISEIKVPRAVMEVAKSRDLQTTIRVGKGGLSESVVNEVREQLDSKPLVKIKLNRGVAEPGYTSNAASTSHQQATALQATHNARVLLDARALGRYQAPHMHTTNKAATR